MSDDIYYEKYIKYKIKYLREKERLSQEGGILERIGSKLMGSLKGNLIYFYNSDNVKGTQFENMKKDDQMNTIDLDQILANKAYSGNENDNKLTLVTLLGTKTGEISSKAMEEAKKQAQVIGKKVAEEAKKQAQVIGKKVADEAKKQAQVIGQKVVEEIKIKGPELIKSATKEIGKIAIETAKQTLKQKGGLDTTLQLATKLDTNLDNLNKVKDLIKEKTGLEVNRVAVIKYNAIGKSVVLQVIELNKPENKPKCPASEVNLDIISKLKDTNDDKTKENCKDFKKQLLKIHPDQNSKDIYGDDCHTDAEKKMTEYNRICSK